MENIIIVLPVGLFFGWLAHIFIEGHGLGYPLDILVSTVGAIFGLIIYSNTSMHVHSFWGAVSASIIGSVTFLLPIIAYSNKRKQL